jgi:dipeptidyl aminopeptidase/acylaminoacyl peptidase
MLLGFNYGEYYHKAYSLNQYLVSQGYIVLSVNYRSGIGYGMEFREAETMGRLALQNIMMLWGQVYSKIP